MKRRNFLIAGGALPILAIAPKLSASTRHAARTNWACSVSSDATGRPTATLSVSTDGSAAAPFKLRGVCYSPCPINANVEMMPSLGDFFWDSFKGPGFEIADWRTTWTNDLELIRKMGVNTIKVYCMMSRQLGYENGGIPKVPFDNSSHLFTHVNFLDACWNGGHQPIYVLVGIPVSASALKKDIHNKHEDDFYTALIRETVAQLSDHPAVLGFTIQNEQDGDGASWGNPELVSFWWAQIERLARLAKVAMGSNKKLVGIANHDDLKLLSQSASYMAKVPSIDFWGVNSYQTQNFDSVFKEVKEQGSPGFEGLKGGALKPVILTEWGMPGTGHRDPNDRTSIYWDDATSHETATMISRLVPQTLNGQYPLCLGLYYFEFCDEWWKQKGAPHFPYQPYGGDPNSSFPNKYWDEDGFGLYAIARANGVANNADTWVNRGYLQGPAAPDLRIARTEMVNALRAAYTSY